MSRHRTMRFKCGHPGCDEYAYYDIMDARRAEYLNQNYGGGKYRCVRHTRMGEMLCLERRKIVHESASAATVKESPKLFWGHSGFVHGPGFKAFADDFPPGTVLRVTAEIILPDDPEGAP